MRAANEICPANVTARHTHTHPLNVPSQVTARIAREMGWPDGRVFGSGTCLDSSRFRSLLSSKLGVSGRNVHAYILGEHGDTSVPVWSQTFFGGLRLVDRLPELNDADVAAKSEDPLVRSLVSIPEEVTCIPAAATTTNTPPLQPRNHHHHYHSLAHHHHHSHYSPNGVPHSHHLHSLIPRVTVANIQVVQAAYSIIKGKGYTNWAIGLATARLCEAVLRNERAVLPVSVSAKGRHGIEQDVYVIPSFLNSLMVVMNLYKLSHFRTHVPPARMFTRAA